MVGSHYTTLYRLTSREQQILQLLAEGRTNREIADALVLSTKTVEGHLNRILSKLEVSNRTAAVAVAFRTGLVPPKIGETPQDAPGSYCYKCGRFYDCERR